MHAHHDHHETAYSYTQDRRENFSLPFAAADLAKGLKEVNHIVIGDTEINMIKGGREKFEDPFTGETVEHDVYVVKIKHGKTEAHIALIETADGAGTSTGTRFDMLDTAIGKDNHFAGLSRWDRSYDGIYRKLPAEYVNNLYDSDLDPNAIQELLGSLKHTVISATEKLEKGYGYTDADPKAKAKLLAVGAMATLITACASAGQQPPTPSPTLTVEEEANIEATLSANRQQKESDMAITHAAIGTPVAPEKWKPLYEVAQKNTVEMFLLNAQCSGTLVNGSIVGRPDMGIIITAKHCLFDLDAYAKRTGALSFKLPNQLTDQINIREQDYAFSYPKGVKGEINEGDTLDIGVIVFPLFLSDKLQVLYDGAIKAVDDTFTGDKEVMAAGFPHAYDVQLGTLDPEGVKQPLIQVIKPGNNKPDEIMFTYETVQHDVAFGGGGSGGGVYDEDGKLCGVIIRNNNNPGMERQLGIAPLRDIEERINEAFASYEAKKG